MSYVTLAVSQEPLVLAPEKHVYEDPTGVVLRARLCTRVYTELYT